MLPSIHSAILQSNSNQRLSIHILLESPPNQRGMKAKTTLKDMSPTLKWYITKTANNADINIDIHQIHKALTPFKQVQINNTLHLYSLIFYKGPPHVFSLCMCVFVLFLNNPVNRVNRVYK